MTAEARETAEVLLDVDKAPPAPLLPLPKKRIPPPNPPLRRVKSAPTDSNESFEKIFIIPPSKMEDALAHLTIAAKSHTDMTPDEKFVLITRNLQETLGGEAIKAVLNERDLALYWGTATTGKPHIGYFVPMSKIADFLKAGCKVKILLADLHAFLDNQKAPWDLLRLRTKYYEFIIKAMLESIGVPIAQLEFIVGTTFQLSREYNLDAYRLAAIVTEHDAKKAGAEVVKQVDNALLSGLIYPGLQALDEEYLKVDTQFGGTDQRKIFTYAEKYLPQLGYKKRSHLMNFMVPGLMGSKMSSSDPDSKIDLLDDAKTIERKIKKAFCEEGNIQENGLLSFSKFVLFPLFSLRGQAGFSVTRKPEYGGNVVFGHYQELEDAFAKKDVHPGDLKKSMCFHLNELLEPIRARFLADPEMVKLTAEAYPEVKVVAPTPAAKSGASKKPVASSNTNEDISRLRLLVGKILSVDKHPDADSLYVEKIDVGEEAPRTIVSGLVKYYTVEQLVGKSVIILANLKPSKLRGIMSEGMVLAGSNEAHTQVEVLEAPSGAKPGQQVVVEGFENVADDIVNPKQKFYGEVFQALKVDGDCVATYKCVPLQVKGVGKVTVSSLKNSSIG